MEIVGGWPPSTPTATGSPLVDCPTGSARRLSDGDYVREHITHGYAVTVHTAQGVTADATHSVLGEKATRAALYVAMTRGREHRPPATSLPKPVASVCQCAWQPCSSTAAPTLCRGGGPPTAIGAQRPKRGRRVTNRAPTNTYASRLTTASSCNAGPRNLAGAACDAGA